MISRDRVVDEHALVHYATGTQAYLDTGTIWIKTLCSSTTTRAAVKTRRPIPPTCLACIYRAWRDDTFYDRVRARQQRKVRR